MAAIRKNATRRRQGREDGVQYLIHHEIRCRAKSRDGFRMHLEVHSGKVLRLRLDFIFSNSSDARGVDG